MAHAHSSEIQADRLWPAPAEPAEPLLRRIGRWLRDARTQRGLGLHEVAGELRIKVAYLEALENGQFAPMPGRPYALGFLRSYAVFLGLDGDELVRRVKADERGEIGPPELSVPMPMPESRVPKLQLLVASVFLAGGVYSGWQYVNGDHLRLPEETVAAVPAELREAPVPGAARRGDPVRAFAGEGAPLQPAAETAATERPAVATLTGERTEHGEVPPAEETAATVVAAAAEPEHTATPALTADLALPVEPSADRPRDAGRAESGPSAAELLARLAAAPAGAARDVRVYGRANGDTRVRLEAVDTSWIQVRSTDNTYTYTRTLQPGDVYLVPNRADLGLWTGNAGGLRIIVDGRSLPPLGVAHEVKRDLPLDPETLLARAESAAADRRR